MSGSGDVYRRSPLLRAPARGRLVVPREALTKTVQVLREAKGDDGPHEGLVFWAGVERADSTTISLVIEPRVTSGWGHVHVDELAVAEAARRARGAGLALLCQVHSHPGDGSHHSDGDDTLVLMPFEGMFSLVIGRYGSANADDDLRDGLHQYQDGRWVLITDAEVSLHITEPS